ncbi:hypothetical protein LguiA_021382 [Lonicera macranthoides]
MQSFCGRIRVVARHKINNVRIVDPKSTWGYGFSSSESNAFTSKGGVAKSFESPIDYSIGGISELAPKFVSRLSMVLHKKFGQETYSRSSNNSGTTSITPFCRDPRPAIFQWAAMVPTFSSRCIATVNYSSESVSKDTSASISEPEILDKEAVEEVRSQREIPDIKPGYIIQLKLEVPENKRRNSLVKGIVIARRNAGLNTTIRLRRMVAGVGVESLLPFLPFVLGLIACEADHVLTKYKRDKGAGQEESEEGQALLSQGEIEST